MKPIAKPLTLTTVALVAVLGAYSGPAAAADCKSAEEIRALVKSTGTATPEEYKAVLETFACCTFNERDMLRLDSKTCTPLEALKLLRKDKVKTPPIDSIFADLAASPSPQVRAVAYGDGGLVDYSDFFKRDAIATVAKKAMTTETDPGALRYLVNSAMNSGNAMPEAGEFLKKMSTHENPVVRYRATVGLANSWSDKVPGVVDAVVARMNDEDKNTRGIACSGAGKLGDDAVVAPITAILKDPARAKDHGECVRGLVALWLDAPKHEHTSAAAYKATMDYLKTTPRSKDVPAWTAVSALSGPRNAKTIDAWKAKASYYKPDEIIAIMTDIAKDPQADRNARTGAVKVIGAEGGTAALDKLAPVIDGLGGDDKNAKDVKSSLETARKAAAKAEGK